MTFLYPLFLFGLFLTAVPIIIHLWFQKKLQRMPFSTLLLLKKTEAQRFGWLRLREIVTLIMRCLIIFFLFLSLSRPQLTSSLFGAGRSASVVVLLDNSYSMSYGDNFTQAQAKAQDIVRRFSAKSEFFVVPLCTVEHSDSLVVMHGVGKTTAHELLENITLSYQQGNIRQALSKVEISEPRYPLEYIYIGDGQEHNFEDFPLEMSDETSFFWYEIPVGSNVSITQVMLKDPIAVPLEHFTLRVEITNFSSELWKGTAAVSTAELYIEKQCEIEPAGNIYLEFAVPITSHHGEVKIYDDSLTTDNTYYFSKSPPRQLKILIVSNENFLYSALSTSSGVHSPFTVESVRNLSAVDLRSFDAILLNGSQDITPSDRIKLDNFMTQQDRAVLCFLGQTVGTGLKAFIEPCCTVDTLILPKGYVTLDWIDYTHPIFSVFVGTTTLLNARFYRFHKVTAQKTPVAKLTGNYPFLVMKDNLAVITTQFTPAMTDLVYKAAFVPLLFRLIVSSIGMSYDNEFFVGEKITDAQSVKAPTGELIPGSSVLHVPGFYTVDGHVFGVNVVPDEGNVKKIGTESARALNVSQIDPKKDLGASDLSTILLYCALCALLLELILLAL